MSYKLLIRRPAKEEMFAAFRWYKEEQPGLEEDWLTELDAALLRIQQHPLACPVVFQQVRRALVHRFPYHLFFTVTGHTVRVLACLHAKRDPNQWKDRL